jgi:hypothetical protein
MAGIVKVPFFLGYKKTFVVFVVMTLPDRIVFVVVFSGGTERKSEKSGSLGSVMVPGFPSP